MAAPESLEAWLSRLVSVPPDRIELGLARVSAVHERLGRPRPAPIVLTVGGTNGKGSTVAFLVAMLRAAGLRVGAYTSPHLFDFNERITIDEVAAGDDVIVAAFKRVDAARGETLLTFFEFATLAALLIFSDAALDVAVLEVGLGGRLDAVNLIDADVAIVTTIDLDHQQFLGDTRAAIAVEKAGIARAGRPVILADRDPPPELLAECQRVGAVPWRIDQDYRVEPSANTWAWISATRCLNLPEPILRAPVQHDNAAAAIAALMALGQRLPVSEQAIDQGLRTARLRGRLEIIPGDVEVVVDVGHNPQAAGVLATWLRQHPRRTRAVFSALADKDVAGIVQPLLARIAHWHLCGLEAASTRGLNAVELAQRLDALLDGASRSVHPTPALALAAAIAASAPGDRVLVFGSFLLVGALASTLNPRVAPAN